MTNEIDAFIEVTEQLQLLKETVKSQQNNGLQLQGVYASFNRIADEVVKLPSALGFVLTEAKSTANVMKEMGSKMETLSNTVPDIVARIERSDFGQTTTALTDELKRSRDDLAKFEGIAITFEKILDKHSESQTQWHQDVTLTLNAQFKKSNEMENHFFLALEKLTKNQEIMTQKLNALYEQQINTEASISNVITAFQNAQTSSNANLSNLVSTSYTNYGVILEKVSKSFQQIAGSTNEINESVAQIRNQEIRMLSEISDGILSQQKMLKKIEEKKTSLF